MSHTNWPSDCEVETSLPQKTQQKRGGHTTESASGSERFTQVPGVDFGETYAPVTQLESVQTVLHIGAMNN